METISVLWKRFRYCGNNGGIVVSLVTRVVWKGSVKLGTSECRVRSATTYQRKWVQYGSGKSIGVEVEGNLRWFRR